jgi:hypothetical protein
MNTCRRHARAWEMAAAFAIGVAVLALAAAPAFADAARARAHFDLGKRYFEVDEYQKAIEEFKAAHVEEPDPAFLYNIAECYRHMGETKEALVYYRRFLLLSAPNAPTRSTVEKRVAALQAAMRDAADVPPAPAASTARTASVAPTPRFAPAPPATATAARPAAATAPAPERPSTAPVVVAMDAPPEAVAPPATDLSAQASPPSRAAESRPFYKSPWFYVIVGGALVAGTVGAFALASGKDQGPPSTPLGNQPAFR